MDFKVTYVTSLGGMEDITDLVADMKKMTKAELLAMEAVGDGEFWDFSDGSRCVKKNGVITKSVK